MMCCKKQKQKQSFQRGYLFTMLPLSIEVHIFLFDPTSHILFTRDVIPKIPKHQLCYFSYRRRNHVYRTFQCTVAVQARGNEPEEMSSSTTDTCWLCLKHAVCEDVIFVQEMSEVLIPDDILDMIIRELNILKKHRPSITFEKVETLKITFLTDNRLIANDYWFEYKQT